MAKIAVLGYGTVGSGVVELIDRNQEEVNRSAGEPVEVKYILDLRDFPGDKHEAQVVHDIQVILDDPEVSVICETMGGLEPAFTFEKEALSRGKSVTTSNKELVAAHGPELVALAKANNCSYLFEASVGGGIPILRTLNSYLAHEQIDHIAGIMNGTTNYIITKMNREGAEYETVLKEAQAKGYAERNPEADVEGYDTCRKTAILASMMTGKYVSYESIPTTGITNINQTDFAYARGMNCCIRLLGVIRKKEDRFYALVAPFLVPFDHPLSGVKMVYNAILVHSNMLGNTMYYGKGAGKEATASAVIGDVVDLIRGAGSHIDMNLKAEPANLASLAEIKGPHFVRVEASQKKLAMALFNAGLTDLSDTAVARAAEKLELPPTFAFMTTEMTEKEFLDKYDQLEGEKNYFRILAVDKD